jgi:acyl CoA:acetate/3-ketoacid CoA transferase beta subunit
VRVAGVLASGARQAKRNFFAAQRIDVPHSSAKNGAARSVIKQPRAFERFLMTTNLHARVGEITERIAERSRDARRRYLVIIDLGVFAIDEHGFRGMAPIELAPGVSQEEIAAKTEAAYRVALG